jgi:hypothetical protein
MRPIGNETGAAMSSTAFDLRDDYAGSLPAFGRTAGAGAGQRTTVGSMRLLDYWRSTLPLPVAARRRALDAVYLRARRDAAAAADLVSFALGDPDEEIVYRATLAHVECARRTGPRATTPVRGAIEWVARGLALNRAAVFAALASLDDESVLEMLRPFRLVLDEAECVVVHRRLKLHPAGATREFLRAWAELRDPAARYLAESPQGVAGPR